jgi:SOS-response transcriptional repressor LexA
MSEQIEVIRLENSSLDDVVTTLLSGKAIAGERNEVFRLSSSDSLKIFAYYTYHRDLWPRNRQVQAREIDGLLQALEAELPQSPISTARAAGACPVWNLRRIEAHRYGGLHRHCGPQGQDPEPFVLEIDKDLTLISGFNGAGKTALLSSIIWCLTGKALRSQHMPDEVHEPMTVEWAGEGEDDEHERVGHDVSIPPIVPIPSGSDLEVLADQPRLDTWVRLTFRNNTTGESRSVTRRLVGQTGRRITMTVEGLGELGLSRPALEVGTLMPGIAAHMRFDEKTGFAEAIAQLTGLKPLEDLGKRSQRIINRLRKEEVRTTEQSRLEKFRAFEMKKQALVDAWQAQPDLGTPAEFVPPGQSVEGRHCAGSITAARIGLQRAQRELTTALEGILGRRMEFAGKPDIDNMLRMLEGAADQLKGSSLGNLPSLAIVGALGAMQAEDVETTETLAADILRRARALAERLEDRRQAARWQLYARVAAWHREHHPGADIVNCPVCGTQLSEVPADALVDLSVREALEHCQEADADMAKTGAEWERSEADAFLGALPQSVRGFADRTLPESLVELYRKGFVDELLSQKAFGGRLEPLKTNGQVVWRIASTENPLPDAPVLQDQALPEILRTGTLAARLLNVRRAIQLAKHRAQGKEPLKGLLKRYIGTAEKSENAETGPGVLPTVPNEAPLRDQIDMIRRAVQNAAPIVSLIRQLDELDSARQAWETENRRLELLGRAATAMEPFLHFPDLVYEQVSGLIKTLSRGIADWQRKLYRPHYCDGPDYSGFDPTQETGVGLRAGIGDMRVPAHQIMNASQLRACVWAFLFSLWEHVRRQAGGLDCLLLDDPQTHFDPMNSENLAAAISEMPAYGMHPIVASNDTRFVASIQDKLPRSAAENPSWTALDLDPISSSRLTASVSPAVEEIRERRDRWREDQNSVSKAQEFVERVRIHVENRLWNLLATDPLVMHEPTLADLLNQLRGARNRGERPFDEPPFEALLDHPGLRENAAFYGIINKAHHRLSEITPVDAREVAQSFEGIENLLRSCTASYARFMGRLTREDSELLLVDRPIAPTPVELPVSEFTLLGQLSARSTGDRLAETEQSEKIDLSCMGPLALYAIRGRTLGTLALAGQVVVVAPEQEARDGDPVIALCGDKTYARRLGKDARDPSRITLVADRSGTERVPPALMLPTAKTLVMPIVGILYDRVDADGREEAAAVNHSAILDRLRHAARVVDDSAHPIIRDGDVVLIEPVRGLAHADVGALEGRIVAAVATNTGDNFGFLKRVGQEVEPGVRIFENIGLNGSSLLLATSAASKRPGSEMMTLERLWRVHGVLRFASR